MGGTGNGEGTEMKTRIGNYENGFVTTINVRRDDRGDLYITERQRQNALARMHATPQAALRFVPVEGAWLDEMDFEVRP